MTSADFLTETNQDVIASGDISVPLVRNPYAPRLTQLCVISGLELVQDVLLEPSLVFELFAIITVELPSSIELYP